ncbi:MAG TPA: NAD(P)-dependent oxidoreductase [Thermoplasmata archaeon]|nr:NAD(P)-dependent oxidoreductase [Thermoplasmata archaeon]
MADASIDLLLATRPRDAVRAEVARQLPRVRAKFLEGTPRAEWLGARAVLLGSVAREAADWDPAAMPNLEFIQRTFTGLDDLPFDRIPPRVSVAGNVGGYAPFVAEHALALALAAARSIVTAHAQVAAGRLRPPPENRALWRKTAVILGYGEIGREIADRLRPFRMELAGVNRSGAAAPGVGRMFDADHLREALAVGDVVFEARPFTRRTARTIGAAELAAMPPEGIFVNVGRAGTVDEEALYRHLVDHPAFRAAIDVWWQEGFADGALRYRFPFPTLPNFVGTPHSAGFAPPVEAYALERSVANLARFFAGERPRHLVDRDEYPAPR